MFFLTILGAPCDFRVCLACVPACDQCVTDRASNTVSAVLRPSRAVSTLLEVTGCGPIRPPGGLTASTPVNHSVAFVVERVQWRLLQAWTWRKPSASSRLRGQTSGVSSRSRRWVKLALSAIFVRCHTRGRLELAIYKQCSKTYVGYITRGGPHIRVLSSAEWNTSCGDGNRSRCLRMIAPHDPKNCEGYLCTNCLLYGYCCRGDVLRRARW